MPPLALSTMWAQQDRFRGDFGAFVRVARDAGFAGIEVSHSTDEAGLRQCLASVDLPVLSLHAPTPRVTTARGESNTRLNLASLDEAQRTDAIATTRRTLEFAAEHGVRSVVVHLGSISAAAPRDGEHRLRALFGAGQIDSKEADLARAETIAARAGAVPAHIEAAKRSLEELVSYAAPLAVAIGLENRLHYHEIPTADEALSLLAEYAPSDAGYWHDVGHAEVWSRLGLFDHRRWFELLGDRLIGCHLHDVRDLTDHRAPGNGTVDWAMIAAGIPPDAARTCEIDQNEPETLVQQTPGFLSARGVIPPRERGDR